MGAPAHRLWDCTMLQLRWKPDLFLLDSLLVADLFLHTPQCVFENSPSNINQYSKFFSEDYVLQKKLYHFYRPDALYLYNSSGNISRRS